MKKLWDRLITDRDDTNNSRTILPDKTELVNESIEANRKTEKRPAKSQTEPYHCSHLDNIGQAPVAHSSKSVPQLPELKQQVDVLTKELHLVMKMRNDELVRFDGESRRHELQLNSLRNELEEERKYRQILEENNVMLRTDIDSMRDRGAINSDEFYSSRLKSLKQ